MLRYPCYCCGVAGHSPSKCDHCEVVCRNCHKSGHLAKVCRSCQLLVPLHHVNTVTGYNCSPEREAEFTIITVGPTLNNPMTMTVQIDECPLGINSSPMHFGQTLLTPHYATSYSYSYTICSYHKQPIMIISIVIALLTIHC